MLVTPFHGYGKPIYIYININIYHTNATMLSHIDLYVWLLYVACKSMGALLGKVQPEPHP